jgi:serine/threonine protein kinase
VNAQTTIRHWCLQFAMTFTDNNGRAIILGRKLGSGGEADIYAVSGQNDQVAKIYFAQSSERSAKLKVMVSSPPADPTGGQGHVSICWPKAVLFNQAKACAGFLMHRVDFATNVPVLQLYNPQDRQKVAPGFNWGYLLRSAANIASVVEAIHACGYVVGDLNESNFLVSDRALVTLVDCDSMQVPKPGGGSCFRCTVGKPDFTAPELQGRDFGQVDRDPTHDNFALGVMIFHLLMEGVHPYAGVWRGRGDPPPLEQRIRSGDCPYAGSGNVLPMPAAVRFDILPGSLKSLVVRCFGYGHKSPGTRPSAREWRDALNGVERNLETCSANRRHVYANHLLSCPWCERTIVLSGFDPFPSVSKQQPLTATPFVSAPPKPVQVPSPLPAGPGSPPVPAPSPAFLRTQSPGPARSRAPILIGSVIGAGLLAVVWYNAANRQPVAIPPAPSYSPPANSVGKRKKLLAPQSKSAAPESRPPVASPINQPTREAGVRAPSHPAPAANPTHKALVAPDADSWLNGQGNSGLPDPQRSQTPAPVIAAFEAVPTPVEQCAVAILRWTVQGATSVSIEPGIGMVDAASGYKVVRPVHTSRYTLKAASPGGSVSRDVTLSVLRATRSSCGQ